MPQHQLSVRLEFPLALAFYVFPGAVANADTAIILAAKDNTLYESPAGSLSNGAGQHFFVGRTAQSANSIRRGLIAFDIAGNIPAASTIDSVELNLRMSRTRSSVGLVIELHRVLDDWGEGSSRYRRSLPPLE